MYNIKIIIDYKLKNWNDIINTNRINKYAGAKEKKKEMDIIRYFLLNTDKIKSYPIKINCYWHISNVLSDLDNKCIKSVLDQLQLMDILENDNVKYISEIHYYYIKDKKDYLEIEIEEA